MFVYEEDIQSCLSTLQKGGLILYPTDTVWGIGCDATNEEAVAKIFALKNRVDTKAMIILLADETLLSQYVVDNNVQIFDYIKGIHKPTTVIYQQAKNLAINLVAADGSVAIRITKDAFCKDLMKVFGKPIVSTSANISGLIPNTSYIVTVQAVAANSTSTANNTTTNNHSMVSPCARGRPPRLRRRSPCTL